MAFKFQLGEYLIDAITGLKGAVISRGDSLTGCNQYLLQPDLDVNRKYVEGQWLDEGRLKYDEGRFGKKIELPG